MCVYKGQQLTARYNLLHLAFYLVSDGPKRQANPSFRSCDLQCDLHFKSKWRLHRLRIPSAFLSNRSMLTLPGREKRLLSTCRSWHILLMEVPREQSGEKNWVSVNMGGRVFFFFVAVTSEATDSVGYARIKGCRIQSVHNINAVKWYTLCLYLCGHYELQWCGRKINYTGQTLNLKQISYFAAFFFFKKI